MPVAAVKANGPLPFNRSQRLRGRLGCCRDPGLRVAAGDRTEAYILLFAERAESLAGEVHPHLGGHVLTGSPVTSTKAFFTVPVNGNGAL
jgi:hypothetical protein